MRNSTSFKARSIKTNFYLVLMMFFWHLGSAYNLNCTAVGDREVDYEAYRVLPASSFEMDSFEDSLVYDALHVKALYFGRKYRLAYERILEKVNDPRYWKSPLFSMNAANTAHVNGDWVLAIYGYKSVLKALPGITCLNETEIKELKDVLYLNMSSAYLAMEFLDSAEYCLERAKDNPTDGLWLNNNLVVETIREDYENALNTLNGVILDSIPQPHFRKAIKFNLLNVYMHLNMHEEAQVLFKELENSFDGITDTISLLKAHLDYYVFSNDSNSFNELVQTHRGYIERNSFRISEFKLANQLSEFAQNNRAVYAEGWELWKLKFNPSGQIALDPDRMSLKILSNRTIQINVLISLLILTAIVLFFLGGKYYSSLNSNFYQASASPDSVSEKVDPLSRLTAAEKDFLSVLTIKETLLLRFVLLDESAKTISTELRCSVGHVYNLRSSLRRKYEDLYEGKCFEDWVKTKL